MTYQLTKHRYWAAGALVLASALLAPLPARAQSAVVGAMGNFGSCFA